MIRRLLLAGGLILAMAVTTPASADQRDTSLDNLFDRLASSGSPSEAQRLTRRIWSIWLRYDGSSDFVRPLMRDALRSTARGRFDRAIAALDAVIEADPDYAEGWNKRATVRFLAGDYPGSVADIERVLALEPRHFGAMSGLGLILWRSGKDEAAIRAFEQVLLLNPHAEGARANIEEIREDVARGRI